VFEASPSSIHKASMNASIAGWLTSRAVIDQQAQRRFGRSPSHPSRVAWRELSTGLTASPVAAQRRAAAV
jgi:hypothetical protein